jgi:acetate kinase
MQILTINVGSSSLKSSFFLANNQRKNFHYDLEKEHFHEGLENALDEILKKASEYKFDVIGHRFVHGGDIKDPCSLLTETEIERLKKISKLAPLHMPNNLFAVQFLSGRVSVPQIACFDTAFHSTLTELAWKFPIPDQYGMRRYGFHGLSYSHISRVLPDLLGDVANKNIVIAHLGSGASLCLLQNLHSIDTTMGYTPAGGIPMATRSGDIDPGVILELSSLLSYEDLMDLVYHGMGLIALSNGESAEMKSLLMSKTQQAKFAVQYFADHVRSQIGAYAAKAGGVDALVFAGGIGEHSHEIREMVCKPLEFIGFMLSQQANQANEKFINDRKNSKPILILEADEEAEIARLVSSYNI